jgi:hypothetical protein
MENFNTYQQVIDALKAAYVDARNIKRLANQQKRKVNNAGSYLTRKENEKETLEDKAFSVKQVMDTNTSNSFTDIQDSKSSIFREDLASLKSKLVEIEKEKQKLDAFAQLDTEATPDEYNATTATQLQTIGMIQNMVVTAIGQTETIYADTYTSGNYYNLKSNGSAVPDLNNSNPGFVEQYYMQLTTKFENVYLITRTKFNDLMETYFLRASSCRDKKGDIYYMAASIENAKVQLASLLENGGTEPEISAVETAIEGYKNEILLAAEYLKMDVAAFDLFDSNFVLLVEEYFDAMTDAYTDLLSYWQNHIGYLSHQGYRSPRMKSQELLFDIIGVFFNKMETIFGNVNSISPYAYMEDKLKLGLELHKEAKTDFEKVSKDLSLMAFPLENMTENYTDENGVSGRRIRKDVPMVKAESILNYVGSLHDAFADYVQTEAERQSYTSNLNLLINEYSGALSEYDTIRTAHAASSLQYWNTENETIKLATRRYTGTPEQEAALQAAIEDKIEAQRDFSYADNEVTYIASSRDRYMALFPEFYSTFTPLYADWRPSLEAKLLLIPTHNALEDAKSTALSALNSIIDTVGVDGPGYAEALQNSTDADAAYAAFVIVGGEWDSTVQLEEANVQLLEDYLDNVQLPVYSNLGGVTYSHLLSVEDVYEDAKKARTAIQVVLTQKIVEVSALESNMTIVYASDADKLSAFRTLRPELDRIEKLNQDLGKLKTAQESYLGEIVAKLGGHVSLLDNLPSTEVMLQNGIDFLTSASNYAFTKHRDKVATEFNSERAEMIRNAYTSMSTELCPLGFDSNQNLNGNGDILDYIKNSQGLSKINSNYRSTLTTYTRQYASTGFANAAIDYVNNGGSFTAWS